MPETPAKPPSKPRKRRNARRAGKPANQDEPVIFEIRFKDVERYRDKSPLVPIPESERKPGGFTHRRGNILVRVETLEQEAERRRQVIERLKQLRSQIVAQGGGNKSIEEILEEIEEDRRETKWPTHDS